MSGLEGILRGEVAGPGSTGHVGVAGGVYGDVKGCIVAAAAEVSGVGQRATCRIQLRHEGFTTASECGLKGS